MLLGLFGLGSAQIISRYDFNSTAAITTATIGLDAVSIHPNAVAPAGVAHLSAGCGAGAGMDMELAGEHYEVRSIDITVRFARAPSESTGRFFVRDNFYFGFDAHQLSAQYETVDGFGNTYSYTLNSNQNVIPNNFRVYGFSYDNCTGVATLTHNGNVVASFDGPDEHDLRFNGGQAFVGAAIDNGCSQIGGLDWIELHGSGDRCTVLGLEWVQFEGQAVSDGIQLDWITTAEVNNAGFSVERSADGLAFVPVGDLAPVAADPTGQHRYSFTDASPGAGVQYYRIRQQDFDGHFSYSPVIQVKAAATLAPPGLFPNPAHGHAQLAWPGQSGYALHLYSLDGHLLQSVTVVGDAHSLDLSGLAPGLHFVELVSAEDRALLRLWVE